MRADLNSALTAAQAYRSAAQAALAERLELENSRVPAKAGTHLRSGRDSTDGRWTPAFAGEHDF